MNSSNFFSTSETCTISENAAIKMITDNHCDSELNLFLQFISTLRDMYAPGAISLCMAYNP